MNNGHWILAAATAAVFTNSLHAQSTSIVFPPKYAKAEAPNAAMWALSPFNARRQLILDEKHLPGLRGKKLRAIWVRRNMGDRSTLEEKKVKVKIEISHAPTTAATASTLFARNRGADKLKVFEADIKTPASTAPKDVPVSWRLPHSIEFRFKTPVLYRGGPLCIETVSSHCDKDLWWPIDAVANPGGKVTQFGTSCIQDGGNLPARADRSGAVPGATCRLFFHGKTAEDETFCHLGSSDRYWNGGPLPIDLGRLGVPGCKVYIDLLLTIPVKLQDLRDTKVRYGSVSGTIPLAAAAVGQTIFCQWSIKAKNALGRETSNGVRIDIGAMPAFDGVVWIESPSTGSDMGHVVRNRFPVLRIDAEGP